MTLTPHPELHAVLEALGYVAGYFLFRRLRSRTGGTVHDIPDDHRWIVIAAAAVGALLGSRTLGLLEQVPLAQFAWRTFLLPGGKTIVGGLLGGWLAVEIVKPFAGIRTRTGDLFALPLCLGIAIGRIGCFLAGLADDTYGKPTSLPWAVDFGDGIPRHPTQLYEILFLAALGLILWQWSKRPHPQGILFRAFLAAYLAWRLAIDFLKPDRSIAHLHVIQWACIVGLIALFAAGLHPERQPMCDEPTRHNR